MYSTEKLILDLKEGLRETKYIFKLLENNLNNDSYRGSHNIQHERKTLTQIWIILEEYIKITEKNEYKMLIPPGDERPEKSYHKYDESKNYLKLINYLQQSENYNNDKLRGSNKDLYKTMKKQTLKNLFDLGFFKKIILTSRGIKKDIMPGNPGKGGGSTYITIRKEVVELMNLSEAKAKVLISRKIKMSLENKIKAIYAVFNDPRSLKYNIKNIDIISYTITLSYYGVKNNIGKENSLDDVLDAFFEIEGNKYLKRKIDFIFKENEKITKKFKKGKGKIDWHNFKNQTESLFSYLSITSSFSLTDTKKLHFTLFKLENYIDKSIELMPNRSIKQKKEYFKQHNFKKNKFSTYELHHIVPLAYAETSEEYMMLDVWENMILISPNNHALFPKKNNYYMLIDNINVYEITFCSVINTIPDNDKIFIFKNNDGAKYNIDLSKKILKINKELNNI